ncbi:MAG: T9SS type A sorting domain-containing protein [Chitinophagaceae bacterium]|nr:MAG: T9SS type A sorting domain-containing protein [Chitinophagaceae bacterium]
MRKFYTFLFMLLVICCQQASAQIASFSFAGSDGDETSWPSTEAVGIQQSLITRGPGVTAVANADRFNSKNWTTGSTPDLNDYLEFTITPKPGFSISLTEIVLQHQRSVTGPRSFVIRTSLDDFANDATNSVTVPDVNTNQSSTFTFQTAISLTTPLVIRIYAYNAEAQVLVEWANATESDVQLYVVERSADGKNFYELTKLSPSKNNGGYASYQTADIAPLSKINFYRIKAVETSGHVLYSKVLRVESGSSASSLNLFPNPATAGSQVTLQANGLPAGNYQMVVYNSAAQIISTKSVSVNGGSVSQAVVLQDWPKGMYFLELKGTETKRLRFLIQ